MDEARTKRAATCGPDEHAKRVARQKVVSEESFARAASLFRTVGDVSRLKLLDRLSDGEWCVTELAEAAGVGLLRTRFSQQLRILRAERIVERRRTGKHIYYSLADRHVIDLVTGKSIRARAAEDRRDRATDEDSD